MTDTFDRAFAIVVGIEGGFTNDPRDPGNWTGGAINKGECVGTKYGISAPVSAARLPGVDPKDITLDQAKAIYRPDYWAKVQGDAMPPGLALVLFDTSVNSGVDRAIKLFQAALGVVADGVMGPNTLAALARVGAVPAALETCVRRLLFMQSLSNWKTDGLGWTRRVAGLAAVVETFGVTAAPPVTSVVDPVLIAAVKQAVVEALNEKAPT